MMQNFEELQKLSKDNMDVFMSSFGALSKGMQGLIAEMADYQKKSFEEGSAAMEKLAASKSLEGAFETQSAFMKTSFEGFVEEMGKLGEMCNELSKDAYKPFEGAMAKAK